MRQILNGSGCVFHWSKSTCPFKVNYELDAMSKVLGSAPLPCPVSWGTCWSVATQASYRDALPFGSGHLPLASWQVEWRKSLCTLTGSTCEALWAAFLISPCPPITTFPWWKTPWMGKTSTLAEPSNTSWPCPKDRAFNPESPGGPRPCLTQRHGDQECVLSSRSKFTLMRN